MTSNQRRAAGMAEGIHRGSLAAQALTDDDWSLLLLAAGMNGVAAPPAKVCRQVLRCAGEGSGYFRRGGRPVEAAGAA